VARGNYKQAVEKLVKRLSPQDFEQLIDLILARTGWARISTLGKQLKGIDLEVKNRTADEIAFVQVKSSAKRRESQPCFRTTSRPSCAHVLPPASFSRPLRPFAFSPGVRFTARPYNVVKSAGAPIVFRAAKARKSPRGLPRRYAITVAIADIDKLAPCRKGYKR
jgi:hypothetical protein